jgi:hypothetical protein
LILGSYFPTSQREGCHSSGRALRGGSVVLVDEPARSELVEGLKRLGEYLSSWAAFDDWQRRRGLLEVRERGPELLEAREAVPAREEVDVGESGLHAARERLVGGILLQGVEPDDPVSET